MTSEQHEIDLAAIEQMAQGQPDEEITEEAIEQAREEFVLIPENAVLIPPSMASVVEQRYETVTNAYKPVHTVWRDALEKYKEDASGLDLSDTKDLTKENIIRQNVQTLMNSAYMRNPSVEFTAGDEVNKDFVDMLQTATNNLVTKRQRPGLNLKPKINRAAAFAHLTNFAVIKLEYQGQQGSYQAAKIVYDDVLAKLQDEKDAEKTKEGYETLDLAFDMMQSARHKGVYLRLLNSFNFFLDPEGQQSDLEGANYSFERIPQKLSHIQAKYTIEKDYENEDGKTERRRCYRYDQNKPFGLEASYDSAETTNIVEEMEDMYAGDTAEVQQELAKDTITTWLYHDRKAKLSILYIEGDWQTPLWVWQDDLSLSRFFPYFILQLGDNIGMVAQPGEVSYYSHHQDALNEINRNAMWARLAAFNHWFYDSSSVDSEVIEKVKKAVSTKLNTKQFHGIKMKGGGKLEDFIHAFKLPSVNFAEIFDKKPIMESMTRASRISDAMRGEQFKANTTEDAVQTYNNFTSNFVDGISDRIEGFLEEIVWAVLEVMVSKYDKDQMNQLLPDTKLQHFKNYSVEGFNRDFSMQVVAGSTQRPTSEVKKREAKEIIQGLGQFGKVAPVSTLKVVFKVLRDAFSRTYISNEDVENLKQEAAQAQQMQQQAQKQRQDPRSTQQPEQI